MGAPGQAALESGPDGSSALPRCPCDPDTPEQKTLKSQAHGVPATPALPIAASPGTEATAPLTLRSRKPRPSDALRKGLP